MIQTAAILKLLKSKFTPWIILVIILVVGFFFGRWAINRINHWKSESQRHESNNSIWFDSLQRYRDLYGKEVVKTQKFVLTIRELEDINDMMIQRMVNEAKSNDLKLKNLHSMLAVANIIIDSLRGLEFDTTYVFLGDTTFKQLKFNDGYLNQKIYLFKDKQPLNIYTYVDTLFSNTYIQRRKWDVKIFKKKLFETRLFGKWEAWRDSKFANPKNKTVLLREVTIKNKRKKNIE